MSLSKANVFKAIQRKYSHNNPNKVRSRLFDHALVTLQDHYSSMDSGLGIFEFLLLHNYCTADDNSEFSMSMTTNVFIDLVCFANPRLASVCFSC